MSITPGEYDITIYQGSKWEPTITFTALDLTAGTWRMHVRLTKDNDEILASPTITEALVGSDTEVYPVLTAVQTAALDFYRAVYDLEYLPPSGEVDVVRYLHGTVTLDKEVTR